MSIIELVMLGWGVGSLVAIPVICFIALKIRKDIKEILDED